MKIVDYIDERGRKLRVELPDGAPDTDAPMGIVIGPLEVVDQMNLPEPFATRLHNALFDREIFRSIDIQRKPGAVQGAIQSALSLDTASIYEAFLTIEKQAEIGDNS